MLVKTFGSAVYGVEAITITIEVNVTEGLYTFVVGLVDSAVKESIQRVESAIKSNGYYMPRTKLIINLAPANIRKSGSAFDLPIALGVLAASGQLPHPERLREYVIMGELGLDGSILPIHGTLPIALQTRSEHFKGLVVPQENAPEAATVDQLPVYAFRHLKEVIELFSKETPPSSSSQSPLTPYPPPMQSPPSLTPPPSSQSPLALPLPPQVSYLDFADVKGQENIKRALEIAAAGGHNAVLIGPPGSGKTMLAKRMPGILPPLSLQEALETTKIHSIAGKLPGNATLITQRPFRSPHHTISAIALVGGGSNPKPGEISLAHNGVLFLDELPEFSRQALEVMRQPMEEKKITISRARMSVDFPAGFILLASMNPCPCGYYNHPEKACSCPPGVVLKYLNKVSGPLLDRIDLHVEVAPVPYTQLSADAKGEPSVIIRERVVAARAIQQRRYASPVSCNAQMDNRMLDTFCQLDAKSRSLLQAAMDKLHLSARAHDHILKLGRTIADLADSETIQPMHLAEAIQYRSLDKETWIR